MVLQCTIQTYHLKIKLQHRIAFLVGIPKHSIYQHLFHKMRLLLPQFKKLNQDSNGPTNGKRNLPLLKHNGASWELIFQNNTREVFSLTHSRTTQIPEPCLESIQIQSNTSTIKLSTIKRWKEDTSVSLNISTTLTFSSNNSIPITSCWTFFQWKFISLELMTINSI